VAADKTARQRRIEKRRLEEAHVGAKRPSRQRSPAPPLHGSISRSVAALALREVADRFAREVAGGDTAPTDWAGMLSGLGPAQDSAVDERAADLTSVLAEMAPRLGLAPERVPLDLSPEAVARLRHHGERAMVLQGRASFDLEATDFRSMAGRAVVGHELAHLAQHRVAAPFGSPGAAEYEAGQLGSALARSAPVAAPVHALSPAHAAGERGKKDPEAAVIAKPMPGRISYTIHDGLILFRPGKKAKLVPGVDRVLQYCAATLKQMVPHKYSAELVRDFVKYVQTHRSEMTPEQRAKQGAMLEFGAPGAKEKPERVGLFPGQVSWLRKRGAEPKMGKIPKLRWEHGIKVQLTLDGLKSGAFWWAFRDKELNPKAEAPQFYSPDWMNQEILRFYTWYDSGPYKALMKAAEAVEKAGGSKKAPKPLKMAHAKAVRKFIRCITLPASVLDMAREKFGDDIDVRWLFKLKKGGKKIPADRTPRPHKTAKLLKYIRKEYKTEIMAGKTADPERIFEELLRLRYGGDGKPEGGAGKAKPKKKKGKTVKLKGLSIVLPAGLNKKDLEAVKAFLEQYLGKPKEGEKPKGKAETRYVTPEMIAVWRQIMDHPMRSHFFDRTKAKGGKAPDWSASHFEAELEQLKILDAHGRGVFERQEDAEGSKSRFDRPIEGRIRLLSGLLVPGKEARFAFHMSSPNARSYWMFSLGKVTTRWAIYKKSGDKPHQNPKIIKSDTFAYFDEGPPDAFEITLDDPGEYVVELIANHGHYKARHFVETVRVQSEQAWIGEQEKEAYGPMMGKKGPGQARSRFFFMGREIEYDPSDTERLKLLVQSTSIENWVVREGQTAPGYKRPPLSKRLKGLQLQARELEKLAKQNKGSREYAKAKLAEVAEEKAADYNTLIDQLKRDGRSADKHVFEMRATYVSKMQGLSRDLTLFGVCEKKDGRVHVTLHDTTQLWESKFYTFEGEDTTFFKAWRKAVADICKTYPPGLLSAYTEDPLADEIPVKGQKTKARKTYMVRHKTTGPDQESNEEMYIGIAAALLMLIPGLGAYVFVAYIMYRAMKAIEKLQDEARKGVLTVGSGSIILGDLLLDLVPAIARAKAIKMGAKQTTLWLLTGLEAIGDAVLLTADGKRQIESIHAKLTDEYAKVRAEIAYLQENNRSSTKLPGLRQRLKKIEAEVRGATATVVGQMAKGRAIGMLPRTVAAGLQLKAGKTKAQLEAEDGVASRLMGGEGGPRKVDGPDGKTRPDEPDGKARPDAEGKARVRTEVRTDAEGRVLVTEDNIRAFESHPHDKDKGTVAWTLYDEVSGAPFCDVHVDAKGVGPEMTLNPQKPTMFDTPPGRTPAKAPKGLKAEGFSWTRASLQKAIALYKRTFGKDPPNLPGQVAWKNLENFQMEFAKISKAKPSLSGAEVANLAIREISFGKHRIALGYGDIKVQIDPNTKWVEVRMPDGSIARAPGWINIDARPTKTGPAAKTVPKPDADPSKKGPEGGGGKTPAPDGPTKAELETKAVAKMEAAGVDRRIAEDALRLARDLGAHADVLQMINSGRLTNLRGLRKFLKEVSFEVRQGNMGKLTQLREAATRVRKGHTVSIEGRRKAPGDAKSGQADIVDHTSKEALQMKVVTSARVDGLINNINSAVKQLGGGGGEVPPKGYKRIADVRLTTPGNPLSKATRKQLLEALKGKIDNIKNIDGDGAAPGEIRVTNSVGTFTFGAGEL